MLGPFVTFLFFIAAVLVLLGGVFLSGKMFLKGKRKAAGTTFVTSLIVASVVFAGTSLRYIGEGQVGILVKNVMGPSLKGNAVIATSGEMGPQARILRTGWYPGYWPGMWSITYSPYIQIPPNKIGIITTVDGISLPENQAFAPEWADENKGSMLDADYFLANSGYKGPQSTGLLPGDYPLNTELYNVEIVDSTMINPGTVGVVKSNVGTTPDSSTNGIVEQGYRGIWSRTFEPGEYYMNPHAYQFVKVPITVNVVDYSAASDNDDEVSQSSLEQPIEVKTKDGFKFPVDVRVEWRIEPDNAPSVVAFFYDENDRSGIQRKLRQKMTSTVRSVFRNNAETAAALDYINQRSIQESNCLTSINEEMNQFGITITRIAIGDIDGDGTSEELTALLKTQTDREIATQQVETLKLEQAAAEQQRELNQRLQESEAIRGLETAKYAALEAEEKKKEQISIAQAEAEKVRLAREADADGIRMEGEAKASAILAEGQARATALLEQANAIGPQNLAMIEFAERLRDVEPGTVTPRILVSSGNGSSGGGIWDLIAAFYAERYSESGDLPFVNNPAFNSEDNK